MPVAPDLGGGDLADRCGSAQELRIAPRPILCGNSIAPTMLLVPVHGVDTQDHRDAVAALAVPSRRDVEGVARSRRPIGRRGVQSLCPRPSCRRREIEPMWCLRTSSGVTLAISPWMIWPTFSSAHLRHDFIQALLQRNLIGKRPFLPPAAAPDGSRRRAQPPQAPACYPGESWRCHPTTPASRGRKINEAAVAAASGSGRTSASALRGRRLIQEASLHTRLPSGVTPTASAPVRYQICTRAVKLEIRYSFRRFSYIGMRYGALEAGRIGLPWLWRGFWRIGYCLRGRGRHIVAVRPSGLSRVRGWGRALEFWCKTPGAWLVHAAFAQQAPFLRTLKTASKPQEWWGDVLSPGAHKNETRPATPDRGRVCVGGFCPHPPLSRHLLPQVGEGTANFREPLAVASSRRRPSPACGGRCHGRDG